ncbi:MULTISPECIES: hypothetical protein [Haloferax]|uniref:Uncharacterized protein n=7 Tax=Haloferax TaxID=2251 RepID=A0A384KTQ8_HALVD|nr:MULTISPECIES: hypothetical protein [Haloferax]ADE02558.1 uncharacterized protein HVO_0460 [Haloferax volcanii DS2]ELK54533.1 hypothetical protein D320_09537 [Haloferax sp. BAB-2207]ELY25943.1 hypothetical protein C498_16379 [Haloferax volcanii DS2]ELZ58180.1 hypothetical protein C460_10358 [Haloferax sp. ATCC BAA-646]ELZ62965.1 hypothetical protein C459_11735 [Haloferax sp. ATCC BAA-645]
MATLPNTEPTAESLTKPLTLLGLGLVVVSVAVAGFALRDGDVVTALGMGLLFASGVLTTGISLSGKSV